MPVFGVYCYRKGISGAPLGGGGAVGSQIKVMIGRVAQLYIPGPMPECCVQPEHWAESGK